MNLCRLTPLAPCRRAGAAPRSGPPPVLPSPLSASAPLREASDSDPLCAASASQVACTSWAFTALVLVTALALIGKLLTWW